MQSDKISPRGKFASIENYFHDFSLNLYYANTWGVAKHTELFSRPDSKGKRSLNLIEERIEKSNVWFYQVFRSKSFIEL